MGGEHGGVEGEQNKGFGCAVDGLSCPDIAEDNELSEEDWPFEHDIREIDRMKKLHLNYGMKTQLVHEDLRKQISVFI